MHEIKILNKNHIYTIKWDFFFSLKVENYFISHAHVHAYTLIPHPIQMTHQCVRMWEACDTILLSMCAVFVLCLSYTVFRYGLCLYYKFNEVSIKMRLHWCYHVWAPQELKNKKKKQQQQRIEQQMKRNNKFNWNGCTHYSNLLKSIAINIEPNNIEILKLKL